MKILRETGHDVAVLKSAGTATEMRADPAKKSLLSRLQAAYPGHKVKLPHRLDKITRGIVLAALSDEAVRYYNNEIQNGLWEKYYLGRIRTPTDAVQQSLIGCHKAFLKQAAGRSIIVKSGGSPSFLEILAFASAPEKPGESHVLIRLLTGRYHQVRAMLEGMGIPLVGDPLYPGAVRSRGTYEEFYLEHILLRFRDFSSGESVSLYLAEDPDREPIGDAMKGLLAALADR